MISGYVHPDFGAVTEMLHKTVRHRKGGGAAVAVCHRGEVVVDAWIGTRNALGEPWERDTVAMSFSTTKGVVATATHRLVDRGLIDYDEPVATYWPEFAANGKAGVTVRHLLSHSAGLHMIHGVIEDASVLLDWDAMCAVLAAQAPAYEPGTRHGYHGITYGFLVGEVLRRVTGKTVNEVIRDEIVTPLGLDGMFIGVPDQTEGRLADLIMSFGEGERLDRLAERLTRTRALRSTIKTFYARGIDELLMSKQVHESELPALNGCFTARSLARMYGVLACGGTLEGEEFLSAKTLRRAIEVQTYRPDIVVGFPMRWRLGYHTAATTRGMLPNGFGHFGYGGSGAWADLDSGVSVGMVCNRVAGTPFGDTRLLRMGAAALRSASRRG